jgi:hypothetical protein
MHDRAWHVSEEAFAAAWNGAASPDEATEKVKEPGGGKQVPRWAVLAQTTALRKAGRAMKAFVREEKATAGVGEA